MYKKQLEQVASVCLKYFFDFDYYTITNILSHVIILGLAFLGISRFIGHRLSSEWNQIVMDCKMVAEKTRELWTEKMPAIYSTKTLREKSGVHKDVDGWLVW
jgi:hypothetical protein